jgi:hypothetical protein
MHAHLSACAQDSSSNSSSSSTRVHIKSYTSFAAVHTAMVTASDGVVVNIKATAQGSDTALLLPLLASSATWTRILTTYAGSLLL